MNQSRHTGWVTLTMSGGDTAFQRVLTVIRRRGFEIISMEASRHSRDHAYFRAMVTGTCHAETLRRHLANIVDVHAVTHEQVKGVA